MCDKRDGMWLCMMLCLALSGRVQAVDNATLHQWGDESMSQLSSDFKLSSGLYAQSLTDRWAAYAWGEGIMFSAMVAAARVDSDYLAEAESLANLIQSNYWCTYNNLSGYNASAGNCGDRYTDDNAWIALAMIELYALTNNSTYLSRAEDTMDFIMNFENSTSVSPYGGIRWHETSTGGAAICSTAPTCLANLMLYQLTGTQSYYTDGLRLYNWMINAGDFRTSLGLFHETNQGALGYLSSVVIQCAARLYDMTDDTDYLTEGQNLARAMDAHFVKSSTGVLPDTGKWCGHDYTNALVDLYEVDSDQHWLDVAAGYLTYLHDYCKTSGRYPTNWGDTSGSTSSELLDQASVARAFWTLARTNGGVTPYYSVLVFGDCGYGGWSAGLEYGNYTLSTLNNWGISTNSISSLNISDGYTVVMYDSSDLSGSSLTKTANVWCLVDDSWNDIISSLSITHSCPPTAITPYINVNSSGWEQTAIESVFVGDDVSFGPQPSSGGSWSWTGPNNFTSTSREVTISDIELSEAGNYIATYTNSCGTSTTKTFSLYVYNPIRVSIFQHCNYGGWGAGFNVGAYTLSDIIAAGGLNDDASSALVDAGYQVTFFWDDNFRGSRLVKSADDSCLVNDGWNDEISSMMVTQAGEGEDVLTLYKDCGWTGGWAVSFDIGAYTASDIAAAGGLNNDASSMQIDDGFMVIFYADDNFQGATLTKTADDWCFVDDGWNDVISSMKVLVVDE